MKMSLGTVLRLMVVLVASLFATRFMWILQRVDPTAGRETKVTSTYREGSSR